MQEAFPDEKTRVTSAAFCNYYFYYPAINIVFRQTSPFQPNNLSSSHFQPSKHPEDNTAYNNAVCIDGKININTASQEELMLLPGIGETLSQRIIAYRESIGNFSSIEELLIIKGIGRTSLDKLSEYITLGG